MKFLKYGSQHLKKKRIKLLDVPKYDSHNLKVSDWGTLYRGELTFPCFLVY